MATARQLQWERITDFTPGIADDPGASYPPGQAQRTNTFRCISNNEGALIPLPIKTVPAFDVTEESATPPGGGYCITGLYAAPMTLLPTVLGDNTAVTIPHELFVGDEWLTGVNHRQRLRRFRVYETPGTASDLLKDITFADTATTLVPVGMSFGSTRVLRATPTNPGVAVVIALCPFGLANAYLTQFPDDATPTLNNVFDISTGFVVGFVCHQGRVVVQIATSQGHGVNTITFTAENIIYTPVNNTGSLSTPAAVFIPENPSGFQVLVSMSANELFGVKGEGGGLYITGAINDPVVVNLPMITPTHVQQTPAVSRIGVVYGNRESGVWAWQHGDTCKLLSPRMEPEFWTTHIVRGDYFGNQYGHCINDDWILMSNNWLLDTDTGSWWRLEDTSLVTVRYFTSFERYIYGSKDFYYTNEDPFPIHRWERGTFANSYSWQSQPLAHTLDTRVDVRELTMRARGVGSVVVTFTAQDGTTDNETFTFTDATNPRLKRGNIRVQGDTIVVKIVATGTSGSDAAPTVYDLSYGYEEAQHAAVNS